MNDEVVIKHLPGLHHRNSLYRNGWISFMLCGKSGCGKTSLMAQLIPGISERIKFICIATMIYRNPFHLALAEWAKKNHRICVINGDPDLIRTFVTRLHTAGHLIPGEQEMLLIFDDFSIHNRSGNKYQTLVIEAFTRWRNLGVNLVIVCQDATMVAPNCRNCINMCALFNSNANARYNFNKAFSDLIPDQSAYAMLMRYITSIPYTYILVRYGPFEVLAGKGLDYKAVMNEHSVIVPTYRELMSELGVSSSPELVLTAKKIQKKMGNTAKQLDY